MAFGRGRKRGKKDIEGVIQEIRNANTKQMLYSVESKVVELERTYPPSALNELYSELASKFYMFGEREKSYMYATKGDNRDTIVKILKEEARCAEMERLIGGWHANMFYKDLIECWYKDGKYKMILDHYRGYFEEVRDSSILYFALLSAVNVGNVNVVSEIKELTFKHLDSSDFYYNVILGKLEELHGNYEKAIKYYGEALKIRDSEEIKFLVGRARYYMGDIEGAKKMLSKMQKHGIKARTLQALIYAKENRVKDAMNLIDNILTDRGDDTDALIAKALIMSEHGISGVETYLEPVLIREPYNPIALEISARLLEKKDPEAAKKNYERILKVNERNYKAYLGLARLSSGDKRKEFAEKALTLKEDCTEARVIISEFEVEDNPERAIELLEGIEDPKAYYLMAKAHYMLGDEKNAETYIRKALIDDKDNVEYKFLLAQLLYRRKKEEAEELIRDVLKIQPDNEQARRILAEIIYKDHPEEALSLIEGQDSYEAQWLKVKIYKMLGRNEDAKRELEKMLKRGGDIKEYLELADVSEKEDAIEILTNVLKKHPDDVRVRTKLAELIVDIDPERAITLVRDIGSEESKKITGIAYMNMGKYKEAYEHLVECAGTDYDCKIALVKVGISLGKHRDVLEHAKDIVEFEDSLENLMLLAKVYEAIDLEEAYEAYRKITLKYPDSIEAWKKLVEYAERTGRKRESLGYYDQLYGLTGDYNYLIKKAKILQDEKRYDELYSTYTQILTKHPELEEIEERRDALLIEMGRYKDLIQLAEYWISKKGSKAAKGYYLRALAYKNIGEYESALENIVKATHLSKSTKYRQLYAEILYLMGRHEEAYDVISKIQSKTQDTFLLKAKILRSVGKVEEAESILNKLERAGVKEASVELGKIYIEMGEKERALKHLETAAKSFASLEIYLLGARTAYEIGDYMKALWFINGGLKIDRNNDELWVYRVLSLLRINEGEDALRAVDHLLGINEREEYLLLKAHVLNSLERYEEAYQILSVLPKVEFQGISSQEEMAWSLYNLGEYERSIGIYRSLKNVDMIAANLFALKRYREVLKLEGNTPLLLEIKGDAYLKLGNIEEAKKCYERSAEMNNKSAKKKLADLLYESGELNRAYHLYEDLGDEDSVLRAAEILESLGQYKDSADMYERHYDMTHNEDSGLRAVRILKQLNMLREALRILDKMHKDESVLKEKANILYKLGEYKDAIATIRALEREDYDTLRLLGDIYYTLGQAHRAKEYYLKALNEREDPEILKSLAMAYELTGEINLAAEMYFKCDDDESFHRAERIYKELNDTEKLRLLYEKRLKKTTDVNAMKNLAEIYIRMRDYESAYSLYREIKDYEYSAEVLTKIGMLETLLKIYKRAEESLRLALEMEPLPETYYYLGKLYAEMGKYDIAKEMFLKSGDENTDKELCRLALLTGRSDEALMYGERIIENINDGESWYLFGWALFMAGDYEDALKALKIAEEKGCVQHLEILGLIYLKLRQYDRAIKVAEGMEDPVGKIIGGIAYAKKGDLEQARAVLSGVEDGDALTYMGDIMLYEVTGRTDVVYAPTKCGSLDELESAINIYRKAIKMHHTYSSLDAIYNNLGIAYFLKGDKAKGVEYMEVSSRDNLNLLASYILLKERNAAEMLIDAVKGEYSKSEIYWNNMGVYYANIGNYDDAMDAFSRAEEVCRSDKGRNIIAYNRALLLMQLGMFKSAIDILSTVDLPDALILKTLAHIKLGEYEKAIKDIEEYEGDVGERVLFIKAYLNMKLSRFKEAIASINKLLTKNSKRRDFWLLKGIILANMGDLNSAERSFSVAKLLSGGEDININLSSVMILKNRLDGALSILKNSDTTVAKFNTGCALARKGRLEDAERYFHDVYMETKSEKALYYVYLSALERGTYPEIKEENITSEGEFNLAKLLLSTYNVQVTIVPTIKDGFLEYVLTVKNMSGDTISPFVIHPMLDFAVTVNKSIGPIRPYEESTVVFKTSKPRDEIMREAGIVPSIHLSIEYHLYSRGSGIIEEVKVRNITKYRLSNITITPVKLEGFEAWEDERKIESIDPGEEISIKFVLLQNNKMEEIKRWKEKYDRFAPEYVEPKVGVENEEYKVLFTLYPFEFVILEKPVKYDFENAKRLIKRERRKMLVRNVSRYTEAIVSPET